MNIWKDDPVRTFSREQSRDKLLDSLTYYKSPLNLCAFAWNFYAFKASRMGVTLSVGLCVCVFLN